MSFVECGNPGVNEEVANLSASNDPGSCLIRGEVGYECNLLIYKILSDIGIRNRINLSMKNNFKFSRRICELMR